jgi:CDP-glucose 4,6-dehydratase
MDLDLFSLESELAGPILITGHTGFKGVWLTLLLEQLGVEVIGYSLTPEKDSLYSRLGRHGQITEEFADIRDNNSVKEFVHRTSPAAVIHLAAQPLVLESYKFPRDTFETNVMGTVNLLDAVMNSKKTKAFISVTTDKVYRNDNFGARFKEGAALSGKDPYSASKVGSEAAIAAWQQITKLSDGPKVVAARAGNVIGGGDWAKDRLIPDLVRGFSKGDVVHIRNPFSTRPWQHVLDPLVGYLLSLQKVIAGDRVDAINFGPLESSLSVGEVVDIAKNSWGESAKVKIDTPSSAIYEASNLDLDSTYAQEIIGWKPAWNQIQAVETTIKWWKELLIDELNPKDICLKDIYFALESLKKRDH